MVLERIVEFKYPIVGLAVNTDVRHDPLIRVTMIRLQVVVHATTGELFTGALRRHWREAYSGSRSALFHIEGTEVEATANGSEITLKSHDEQHTLRGHRSNITTLGTCLSAEEPLLIAASESGTIRLWNLDTGEQRRVATSGDPTTIVIGYIGRDGRARIASDGPDGNLHIWHPMLPLPVRTAPLSTRGFSDHVAGEDLLDRGALVAALTDILWPGDDEGPTVITIEGAWGTGKSTLLEFIKNRLTAPAADVSPGRRLTVFGADRMLHWPPSPDTAQKPLTKPLVVSFNPWRHQSSEQVWAGLAKAVTEAAEAAMLPDRNARERYWFARNTHRVDRRHLQRQLWKRIYSPLLSFAGLGFGLSALGALTKLNVGWAWWVTAGLAGLGLLHTAKRYLWDRASAFLPGELFAGPLLSNAFSITTTDPLIRDPYYHARSGYLYLVQHDVQALLKDLTTRGYQLIVLIDDLDRCTPRTTAQVFEAINVFLSDDFPATRFVLGLDTTVVASHVDNAYKELADAKVVAHPDDPSPGWTFLRKLVQLPVRLPRTTDDNVDQVLLAQFGAIHSDVSEPVIVPSPFTADEPETVERVEETVIAIERHAEVREHLRRRLKAQPEQSVREEKRLLNVWQFYVRVLGSSVQDACHLVAVAEIAVRWPAYLHRLRGGWQDLAGAVGDDVQWGATIARLGFAYPDRKAAANLRELLRDCDAQAVAVLANRLF
jgi:hypothetical protein